MGGYTDLAEAIILQAAKDYRHSKSRKERNEIKRFFRSSWFKTLSEDADGEKIIAKLEQERGVKRGKSKKKRRQNTVSPPKRI